MKIVIQPDFDMENSKIEFIFPYFFTVIFIFVILFFPIYIREIVKVKELFNLYQSKLGKYFLRFSLKFLVKLIFVQRIRKSYLCLYLLFFSKYSAEWEKLKCSQINESWIMRKLGITKVRESSSFDTYDSFIFFLFVIYSGSI